MKLCSEAVTATPLSASLPPSGGPRHGWCTSCYMGLARGAYVDLCFVIAWGSRYNVSIEDMRSLPSLPARWV